jgi:hypothetical protein
MNDDLLANGRMNFFTRLASEYLCNWLDGPFNAPGADTPDE